MARKTILITGCSDGGLGSALALAFSKAGWRVFATARNPSKLKQCTAAEIETLQLDVKSESSISTCVSQVAELTDGSLDALLNNAGAGYSMPLMDATMEKTRDVFDLNVISLISVTQAFLPLLMKCSSSSGSMVINNTSISSVGGMPWQVVYNSSKAAAASITAGMRLELAPFGIKVVDLKTGTVTSNFLDNLPPAVLPPDSVYGIARKEVERVMAAESIRKEGTSADVWAEAVVKELTKANPKPCLWKGANCFFVWFVSTFFPVGGFDGIMKKMVGLDIVEQRFRALGSPNKLKGQ
ncbi:IBR finger domain protein [Colletotrichum tofieldiae]|uniref:IBR finger domain protein (Short-chain dehydrogenase) n=1 Tax=Colletotrichum tofieldiae TaxID=708197 RepID=A0A166UY31_9PEZI|nr:IBR finger domain protein (short-chain dehydrogenase) [Colletotrichum tofieldiae]GKT55141.1 IBR finger domain protein [Colletotrichum tofieldiae]GKT75572.1 IBR finger domain protein [Colletotrichum tofieldiae]GKT83253.1 IBR finger domain protein [Colletotrichum tofieldiae]